MDDSQVKPVRLTIPIAIIIAGGLIAGGIFFSNMKADTASDTPPTQVQRTGNLLANVNPITSEDHIRGNPNAIVKIIEYSDYECPFCKKFHATMKQVVEEYGKDGQVAWVYRHFPLDSIHPVKARKEATAAECAAEIGGKDAFWKFSDRFFELTPSNNQTDLDTVLPQIIGEMGLSWEEVNACIESGRYDQHIQDELENAIATGGSGTPWSILVAPNGDMFPISGAQSYRSVKQMIDIALELK